MATVGQKYGISGVPGAWDFAPKTLTPVMAAVVAAGSNSQANAVDLPGFLNVVTTVSATTRAVKLPLAATGKMVIVHNAAATAVKVYPNTGDKVASAATNAVAAATIAAAKGNIYIAQDTLTWRIITGA